MPSLRRAVPLAAVAVALAACGGDTGNVRETALAGRLDALEKRLAALEERTEPLDRVRNDAASLDRRVTSLETSVREMGARLGAAAAAAPAPVAPAPAPGTTSGPTTQTSRSGPAAWNGPTTRPDRTVRRAELRALSDEFRSRLAALRSQPGGLEDPEKTRELLEWYRDQRRAILRGEGRTDQ